jgi:hypothetical protein
MKLRHLSLLVLTTITTSIHTKQHLATFFNPRSISRDAARDLVGWENYINKNITDKSVYGTLSITPEWTQTFRSNRMTSCLFGDSLIENSFVSSNEIVFNRKKSPVLKISGSQVNNRGPKDLLADYFYLPSDFESIIHFRPVIDNFIIDFGFYLGLDAWAKGLYFWLHAPFAHTRWDLNIDETIINVGVNNYASGYFAPSTIERGILLENFTDFINGKTLPNVDDIAFQELKFAQMSQKRLIKSRVAEIRTAVGWNFFAEDHYHVGFNGQLAFPTGLRPKSKFLFEPIVGNGHFWELGVGLSSHYTFWRNEDYTRHCMLYTDINITHLFTTRQARTFDLISAGPLSRYMLATEMTSPAINLRGNTGAIPSAQFNNEYLPVANITTLNVDVDITLQADIVLMFNYTSGNVSYDFGYNYWARSKENITLPQIESFTEGMFALKGDAQIFGFQFNTTNPIALSATESQATIHTGKNLPSTGTSDPILIQAAQHNPDIDFPQLATTNPASTPTVNIQIAPNNTTVSDQINTSIPPVFLTFNDIDVTDSGSHDSSSKLFAHIAYTSPTHKQWQPYIGVGGFVEFDHSPKHNNKNNNHFSTCGTSQWGLWLKTGATF